MKSAWEIALERSGGALLELSDEKKEQIAEIDRSTQAKIATAKLTADQRIAKTSDFEEIAKIREHLAVDIHSIEESAQHKKDAVRNG